MASERDDTGGLDIWDIALPVGGALVGRGVARRLMRRTAKSKALLAAASKHDKAATAELNALRREHEALASKLDDEAAGKITIPPAERDRMVRRAKEIAWTNHPLGELDPNSHAWAMKNPNLAKMFKAEKAFKGRDRLAGRAGVVAGGTAGYVADQARPRRK